MMSSLHLTAPVEIQKIILVLWCPDTEHYISPVEIQNIILVLWCTDTELYVSPVVSR